MQTSGVSRTGCLENDFLFARFGVSKKNNLRGKKSAKFIWDIDFAFAKNKFVGLIMELLSRGR